MSLTLSVNGEERILNPAPNPASIDTVIRALSHNPALVVVEHNGTIVPRSRWTAQGVKNGDQLEIVTIVGGGS